ncbi:MAG TPA: sulfite exporter TauE/SafE family protein [Candidatus Dormibacteraeota bacterium]
MSWGDAVAVLGGLAAGLLSGTIGVGGGIIFVPFMTVGFRLPQTLAQGTSLVAIIPTAIVGGITHIREGNVIRDGAIWMGGGGVVGAILGALIAVHVPGAILARVFGVVLILNAVVLMRTALQPKASTETATIP